MFHYHSTYQNLYTHCYDDIIILSYEILRYQLEMLFIGTGLRYLHVDYIRNKQNVVMAMI